MANRTTAECRKFTPNIFNKSKCSHCFRQREEHSAAALESNRASRKVSKCGYLFVAPDWDFNNPLYRTKRWQRRWFVLYDDGELTYSVDEHPETVPQAIVDMTKVLEVSTAEDVTGHTNSIAITAPERVTFVKGTCPEESKWWLNVLVAFPKSKGRHKRNATFPGGMAANNSSTNSRNRHNSYHKDSMISPTIESSWNNVDVDDGSGSNDGDDVTPNGQDENNINAGNEINNRVYTDQPVSSKSPPTRDKIYPETKAQVRLRNRNRQNESEPVTLIIEDLHREDKLKDLTNSLTNNRWSTPIPDDEKPTRDEPDFHVPSPQTVVSMRPKSLPLASNSTPAIVSAIVKKIPPVQSTSTEISNKTSPSRLQQHLRKLQKLHHERGDPDGGCNLDDLSTNYLSPNSELRVCLPTEDVLNSKKGWLMKQEIRSGEWSKHWFSLRGAALFFYRDPVSEERGVLDGVLDVNSLTSVCEINSSRNYAFQLATWDKRRIILSGLSANSRTSWIAVLKNASGLHQQQAKPAQPEVDDSKKKDATETEIIIKDNTSDDIKREIEKDFIKAQRNQEIILQSITTTVVPDSNIKSVNTTPAVTPITPKSIMFSSDEEYRTASEGGRRDSVDWGSPLSPSPPVPLSLFRSKEKSRPRTGSSPRLHKRSRSSPPSSRRSTVDSVGSEDMPLIHPVQEEISDKDLELRLGLAEKERDLLKNEAREREARMSELLTTLEKTEHELTTKVREMEMARDKFSNELELANRNADKIINRMTYELDDSHKKIKSLEDRLARGIEENEGLYKKLREYEGCNPSGFNNLLSRTKIKRMDSLSDLTNITDIDPYCLDRNVLADEYNELKSRFEKAVNEIKAMKKELKDSQNEYDSLEISYASLKQDFERKQCNDKSQLKMMAERIQDLTLKYSSSERQVRTLKQKLAKSERRRSLSLKSKDQLTVSKEFEIKVNDLEAKIGEIEKMNALKRSLTDSKIACKKPCNLRRKSLEGSASTNSVHLMVRLNDIEKRFDNVHSSTPDPEVMSTTSSLSSSPNVSEHLIDRLRSLENVLVSTKDRIEHNLQQLQALRSSRTRRSVSPISDRKDSFKMIEKSLNEVVKVLRESCDQCVVENTLSESNPIKIALVQLESQLRNKLSNLLNQRRVLRDRNELTQNKDLGLIAERVAFESVCFGILKDSFMKDQIYSDNIGNTEIIETSHQITQLKARLSGKCSVLKSIDSLEVLSKILTKRLMQSSYKSNKNVINEIQRPVDPNLLENIIRQQNEINLIIKRYKNNTLEKLASGLAAETLSYISSNDLVQGAVQEAWRQAQEAVNAELIQSEISHIMLKNAERLENSMKPSCYLLTCDDRLTFEAFADAVQEALRKEMGRAIEELTHCYDDALERLKRSRHLHFDQNRKASEGRILLTEFADIIAHKALVDARIAVLKGDRSNFSKISNIPKNKFSVTSLQKYENMFDDLAGDLNLSNPGDILAEADFEFLYKNHLVDFVNDKSSIIEITSSLSKLENSLIKLNNAIEPTANNKLNNLPAMRIETLQDVCLKCRQLRDHMENLCNGQQQQQKFNNNNNCNRICENCNIMKTNLSVLQAQHDSTVKKLQQDYTKDIMALRQQLDSNLKSMKNLENERNTLLEQISHQTNVVEIRERELTAITDKLKSKEQECHLKDKDFTCIVEKLDKREGLVKELEEKSRLCDQKYLKQDEEYIVLLQERDFVQTELNKERDRTRKLEKRLEMLELEHTKQLECLQEAYREQILSHCSDFSNIDEEEESFRQRYQSEIEQLRTLCEKGLAAMESSHRRIISDLEEKHRKEIERLLVEKEQALAEETQATLAALDAMRKAHQSEVQREVARFKQDFIRQFQKGGEQFDAHSDNNEEELEELRQEILSFSEKYSIKCVENAALEEKLRSANQKLKNFQQMQQLELRNRQFRAHLASDDPSTDVNFVQGLASKDEQPCADSEHVCDENDTSSPSPNPKSPMDFDYQLFHLPKSINEGKTKNHWLSHIFVSVFSLHYTLTTVCFTISSKPNAYELLITFMCFLFFPSRSEEKNPSVVI
ncbi:MPRIP family protein [Megaselia abdita]